MTNWIKEGIKSLKNLKEDKKEYKAYKARIEALPEEFGYAYGKITKYMWSRSGGGDGYDMLKVHYDLIELFEEAVAEGKTVLDVTGEDVGEFADELLKNVRTYTEDQKTKLNKDIHNKLG